MTIHCPKCGEILNDDDVFCSNCGNKLTEDTPSKTSEEIKQPSNPIKSSEPEDVIDTSNNVFDGIVKPVVDIAPKKDVEEPVTPVKDEVPVSESEVEDEVVGGVPVSESEVESETVEDVPVSESEVESETVEEIPVSESEVVDEAPVSESEVSIDEVKPELTEKVEVPNEKVKTGGNVQGLVNSASEEEVPKSVSSETKDKKEYPVKVRINPTKAKKNETPPKKRPAFYVEDDRTEEEREGSDYLDEYDIPVSKPESKIKPKVIVKDDRSELDKATYKDKAKHPQNYKTPDDPGMFTNIAVILPLALLIILICSFIFVVFFPSSDTEEYIFNATVSVSSADLYGSEGDNFFSYVVLGKIHDPPIDTKNYTVFTTFYDTGGKEVFVDNATLFYVMSTLDSGEVELGYYSSHSYIGLSSAKVEIVNRTGDVVASTTYKFDMSKMTYYDSNFAIIPNPNV